MREGPPVESGADPDATLFDESGDRRNLGEIVTLSATGNNVVLGDVADDLSEDLSLPFLVFVVVLADRGESVQVLRREFLRMERVRDVRLVEIVVLRVFDAVRVFASTTVRGSKSLIIRSEEGDVCEGNL